MNCKQGDLAIIVRSWAKNEGKIVRCLRFIPNCSLMLPDGSVKSFDSWETDNTLPAWRSGYTSRVVADSNLKPILGGEGDDETLVWAKKPEAVTN